LVVFGCLLSVSWAHQGGTARVSTCVSCVCECTRRDGRGRGETRTMGGANARGATSGEGVAAAAAAARWVSAADERVRPQKRRDVGEGKTRKRASTFVWVYKGGGAKGGRQGGAKGRRAGATSCGGGDVFCGGVKAARALGQRRAPPTSESAPTNVMGGGQTRTKGSAFVWLYRKGWDGGKTGTKRAGRQRRARWVSAAPAVPTSRSP